MDLFEIIDDDDQEMSITLITDVVFTQFVCESIIRSSLMIEIIEQGSECQRMK